MINKNKVETFDKIHLVAVLCSNELEYEKFEEDFKRFNKKIDIRISFFLIKNIDCYPSLTFDDYVCAEGFNEMQNKDEVLESIKSRTKLKKSLIL